MALPYLFLKAGFWHDMYSYSCGQYYQSIMCDYSIDQRYIKLCLCILCAMKLEPTRMHWCSTHILGISAGSLVACISMAGTIACMGHALPGTDSVDALCPKSLCLIFKHT